MSIQSQSKGKQSMPRKITFPDTKNDSKSDQNYFKSDYPIVGRIHSKADDEYKHAWMRQDNGIFKAEDHTILSASFDDSHAEWQRNFPRLYTQTQNQKGSSKRRATK